MFTHVSNDGPRVDLEDPSFEWCDREYWSDEATPFDHDGDGQPEIALKRRKRFWWDVSVYTLKGGRVTVYPPSSKLPIHEVTDVDGDDRPDLLLALELGDALSACAEEVEYDTTAYTPTFLAHSLPDGTFSTQDDAARKHIQRTCPVLPDQPMSVEDYFCSRVWGRPTESLLAHLKKTQIPERCHEDASGVGTSGTGRTQKGRVEGPVDLLQAAARIEPLTRLSQDRHDRPDAGVAEPRDGP